MQYVVSTILFETQDDVQIMENALRDTINDMTKANRSYMTQPYKNILSKLEKAHEDFRKVKSLALVTSEIECAHIALSSYHSRYLDKTSERLMHDLEYYITTEEQRSSQVDSLIPTFTFSLDELMLAD